jgi:putative acetyltransferase
MTPSRARRTRTREPRPAGEKSVPREITLAIASTNDELTAVRELLVEYARGVPVDLAYQRFREEVRELPSAYAAPGGTLLLARVGPEAAGCVGLRPGPGRSGELKRLFVRPAYRRMGIGRVLVETVVETARGRGYTSLCLDTLPSMEHAYRLYLALGFEPTEPYYETPVPGTRFLAYAL